MPILRGPENPATRDLTEAEKQLGVDLRVDKDGDLVLNNLNDFELIAGGANAGQAVRLALQIEPGGLVYHPSKGTDLQIGEKTKDAFLLKSQIIKSIIQDARVEDVKVTVQVNGGTIFVQLFVGLVNTGLLIPLEFVITNTGL